MSSRQSRGFTFVERVRNVFGLKFAQKLVRLDCPPGEAPDYEEIIFYPPNETPIRPEERITRTANRLNVPHNRQGECFQNLLRHELYSLWKISVKLNGNANFRDARFPRLRLGKYILYLVGQYYLRMSPLIRADPRLKAWVDRTPNPLEEIYEQLDVFLDANNGRYLLLTKPFVYSREYFNHTRALRTAINNLGPSVRFQNRTEEQRLFLIVIFDIERMIEEVNDFDAKLQNDTATVQDVRDMYALLNPFLQNVPTVQDFRLLLPSGPNPALFEEPLELDDLDLRSPDSSPSPTVNEDLLQWTVDTQEPFESTNWEPHARYVEEGQRLEGTREHNFSRSRSQTETDSDEEVEPVDSETDEDFYFSTQESEKKTQIQSFFSRS